MIWDNPKVLICVTSSQTLYQLNETRFTVTSDNLQQNKNKTHHDSRLVLDNPEYLQLCNSFLPFSTFLTPAPVFTPQEPIVCVCVCGVGGLGDMNDLGQTANLEATDRKYVYVNE